MAVRNEMDGVFEHYIRVFRGILKNCLVL